MEIIFMHTCDYEKNFGYEMQQVAKIFEVSTLKSSTDNEIKPLNS